MKGDFLLKSLNIKLKNSESTPCTVRLDQTKSVDLKYEVIGNRL